MKILSIASGMWFLEIEDTYSTLSIESEGDYSAYAPCENMFLTYATEIAGVLIDIARVMAAANDLILGTPRIKRVVG